MNIQKCSKEDLFEYIDLQENDTILYLGGFMFFLRAKE